MTRRLFGLCFSVLMFGSISAKADPFFPIINPGDTFSGTLEIDPATPLANPLNPGLYALPMVNYNWVSSIGTISLSLAGMSCTRFRRHRVRC